MTLIELNFGREPTDDTGNDTDRDGVEIPTDDESTSSSNGRRLLRAMVLLAVVAGAGYLLYRRATARDETEFAEIVFDDETAEVGTESADE